jgi:hypothetical protein
MRGTIGSNKYFNNKHALPERYEVGDNLRFGTFSNHALDILIGRRHNSKYSFWPNHLS